MTGAALDFESPLPADLADYLAQYPLQPATGQAALSSLDCARP
jgi:hypothetical protein